MKRFMFVLLVAAMMLVLVSPLYAKGVMFGLKGGLSEANLSGDAVTNNSYKPGLVAGAFMSYDITSIFSIQPEGLFVMKGAKFDSAGVTAKDKINYIEIPILLKVNLPVGGNIRPSIYAGPTFNFLVTAKVSDGEEIDIKDQVASTDIGLVAGAALAYQMESASIFVEGRYDVGFMTIVKDADAVTGDKADITNSGFQFMVGFGVGF